MKRRSSSLVLFLIMILVIPSITCTLLKSRSELPQRQPEEESSEGVQPDDTTADLPEATGDEIEITQTTTYLDEFGYWNLHGLMTNIAEYPVGNVELEVQIAGAAVNENTFFGAFGIAPAEVLPFGIRLPLSVTSLDGFEVNILQIRRVEMEPVQLEIGQSRLVTAENGIVTLVGELSNNATSPTSINSVKTALFSADGGLVTTASCQVCPGYVTPGDKAPFQFMIYGQSSNVDIDHYEIYTSTEKAALVEGLDLVFVDPIHTYIDPAGSFHILGYLQNNSEKILALQIMGTFYNQNGEIVGASSKSMPGNSLVPGESAPYDLMVTGPIESIVDWSIQVDLARSNERVDPVYQLPTTTTEIIKDQYLWTISGIASNDSEQSLQLITVVMGLMDSGTGKLVGLVQHIVAEEIPPGETIDFSLDISPDPAFDPGALEEFILVLGE